LIEGEKVKRTLNMKHQEDEMGEAHATAEIVNVNNGMQQPMHVEDLDFSMEKRGGDVREGGGKEEENFQENNQGEG
jgi:hypothetical protein